VFTLKSLFRVTAKHAVNGRVIITDPVGLISIVGLVPHTSSQFTTDVTPLPGVIVNMKQIPKQILFLVHAIFIPPFTLINICNYRCMVKATSLQVTPPSIV
jgi:hypothetical protein